MKGGAEEDLISSLPDVILHHILSFIPTKFAIRTSLLSKRWRHVWLDTPSLSFSRYDTPKAALVNELLSRYIVPKLLRFNLHTNKTNHTPHLHKWIEFAMSCNVENLSLKFWFAEEFQVPDFFYINYYVKQLTLTLHLAPRSSVCWTSLKSLSLNCCSHLSNDSMAKILSGCPILESLRLSECNEIMFLDLSKSLRLRTLDVECNSLDPKKMDIVAPLVRCLRLTITQPCTLIDISSITEANLNIGLSMSETMAKHEFLHLIVVKMLEKLQHVEKLTLGTSFLQGEYLDYNLKFQGLNPVQCWKSIDGSESVGTSPLPLRI